MSERQSVGGFAREHWKAALIAGATVAAGTAAVAGVHAIRNKRRNNHTEDEPLRSEMSRKDMFARLGALYDPEIPPNARDLMTGVAARIYYATHNTESSVITPSALLEHLDRDKMLLPAALLYMEQSGLVGRRENSVDSAQSGYFAEAPLSWTMSDDDEVHFPELHQALSAILCEQ